VRYVLAVFLDCLFITAIVAALFILLTGGGVYTIGHLRVSARTPDNLLLFMAVVLAARFAIRHIPWFAVWPTEAAFRMADRFVGGVPAWARALPLSSARRAVLVLIVASVILKAWFAATSPGFVTGDDVEIHEMSLGVLLHQPWPIWDLRSAVFPLGIVFPAQYAAYQAGVHDIGNLVFAGRLVVAVLSTVSVWLVWSVGRILWPGAAGFAVVAAGLFATAKLSIAYGSSELPRPVSTVFVLGAFAALQRRDDTSWRWAAVALAFAASLRFSEAIFIAAALTQLVLERRYRQGAQLILMTAIITAILLGAADAAYWGEAFHSVRAAFDFTVVQGLSSRGFQPPWWYVVNVSQWSTVPLVILAAAGLRHQRNCAVWLIVPLCALSALPHKEARYMIPLVPFVCLLAVEGLRQAARYNGIAKREWLPAAIACGLSLGLIHDVTYYKLRRSNADVRLARSLFEGVEPPPALAVEQAWRMGGHLYLPPVPIVVLDPAMMPHDGYLGSKLTSGRWVLVDRRSLSAAQVREALTRAGYHQARSDLDSSYVLWRP
jgi:hypothetical protein